MSYILEALKKSDKERQREEIPDLQTDHSLPPVRREERKPSGLRLPVLIALIFVCFVGIFWWQSGGDSEVQPAKTSQAIAEGVAPTPPAPSPAPQPSTKAATFVKKIQPVTEKKKQVSRVAEQAAVPVLRPATPVPVAKPQKKLVTTVEKKPVKIQQEPEEIVPLMEDLPVVIRAGLPDLTFAGHVYADDPRKRLIIINNRIVREGDIVASNLSLVQISANGVVLRYKTTVFRVILF